MITVQKTSEIKQIEEKIEKLEEDLKNLLFQALHGKITWKEVKTKEKEIARELRELEEEKLKKIPNAEEFAKFVDDKRLYDHFHVERISLYDVADAVELFLKIPLKYRNFVLKVTYFETEAKWTPKDPEDEELFKKWYRMVYRPLKTLTRQSKIDLTPNEKVKLLDELLKRAEIDVFTLKKLLKRGNVELTISPFTDIEKCDKIIEWLKTFWSD